MPDKDMQPYVEDADENEDPIDGSKTYNSSAPPSVKEEANVSRTRNTEGKLRKGMGGSGSASPTTEIIDDSESDTAVRARRSSPSKRESRRPKETRDKEREKSKAKRKSVTYGQPRPPAGRAKTTPNLNIHNTAQSTSRRPSELAPSHIITTAAPSSRPRAYTSQTQPRPLTHYGSPGYGSPGGTFSRPPQSNLRYYAQPAPGSSYPPPSPYPPGSPMFPPSTAPPYAGPYPPGQAFSPAPAFGSPQPDYFGHAPSRPMPHRPVEYRRPQSAMGHHPGNAYAHHYEDDHGDGGAPVRMPSIKKRPSIRQQEERKLMPPPGIRRPSTAAPTHSPFGPPRPNRQSIGSIRSLDFLDTDSVDDESQYSPSEQSRSDWRPHSVRRPNMDSTAYEVESRYERSPDRRRRNSHYGAQAQSMEREYEDKVQHAQRYQEKFDGPTTSLTADTLRKIARTPSQRTKSTGSRENGSYALTNRNSIDTEDMRILVKGAATLTIGDASMAVQDGAEIRFPTNLTGNGISRGSNGSDTTYDDRRLEDRERRTTVDRPQTRVGRATSRAESHSRGLPASGYYAPPTPTEYSGHGYHYPQQVHMYAPPSGLQYPYPPTR